MWDQIKQMLPALELQFDEAAENFNGRFTERRQHIEGNSLHSQFFLEVKNIHARYLRLRGAALGAESWRVPEKTRAIIRGRVAQLGTYLAETERTGDDQKLLLYVLGLLYVNDENRLGRLIDPLDYQAELLTPLRDLMLTQARDGFNVALPGSESAANNLIQQLREEVNTLSRENSELKQALQTARHAHDGESQATQAHFQANANLIQALEAQAKQSAPQAEVQQTRQEVRAVFKARLRAKQEGCLAEKQGSVTPSVPSSVLQPSSSMTAHPPPPTLVHQVVHGKYGEVLSARKSAPPEIDVPRASLVKTQH